MNTVLLWSVRAFMAVFGLVMLSLLLVFLLGYVLWAGLRWLLTGRRPQVAMVWQQMRQMRSMRTSTGRPADPNQVVDVEVREVNEVHEVREVRRVTHHREP